MSVARHSSRGTVSLIALCFIAVLGIVLASYISVCSRAMNLSNRSFQSNLSQQLAEFGLEEGLRAFNKNDWSNWASTPTNMTSGAWTLDATNRRASRTLTFNAGKLAQGATATVKIRIDNYDANVLGATYSSTTNYRINDLVGYNGLWYRCVKDHSGQTPNSWANLIYWVPLPMSAGWSSSVTYNQYDIVNYNGFWYRAVATSTNQAPPNATYWVAMTGGLMPWNASTTYSSNQVAYYTSNNTWYRYINGTASSGSLPTNPTYWSRAEAGTPTISLVYSTTCTYSFGDIVYNNSNGTWYRCIATSNPPSAPSTPDAYWEYARSGAMWGWSSAGVGYNIGDVVYYSTTIQWYRCIKAHTSTTSITPASTDYWVNTPPYSAAWDARKQYSQYDTASYNGRWYLSLQNSNFNQHPASASAYWIDTTTTSTTYRWDATTAYAANSYHCYDGVWYKCTTATTAGISPNNTSYWTPAWANSAAVTTGAPVLYAEAAISLPNNPTNTTQLRATLGPAPLFPNAAAAKTTLTISAGTGTVDSYDSTLSSSYATQRSSSPATNYSAILAAGTTVAINGTTEVRGYLAWPTPAGGISTGTTIWGYTSPGTPNTDPARVSRSPYIPQFDILPNGPASGGLSGNWGSVPKGTALPTGSTVSIGSPGASTPSIYYFSSDLTMGGGSSQIQTLNINGPVILYINGDLTMTGGPNSSMPISNTGSAEIHIAGTLKVDSGSDGIINNTSDPKSLVILCDSSAATTHFYNEGANPFYGLIYMPNIGSTGGFYFNYNEGNVTTTYGAVSAAKVTFYNSAILHYDTSLRYAPTPGVEQPYAVTEWRKLPVTEQATMP